MDERTYVVRNAADVAERVKVSAIQFRSDWFYGIQGEVWVPALAVPIEQKLAFECPTTTLPRPRRLTYPRVTEGLARAVT